VCCYRAEIWEWIEREELEKIMPDDVKWMFRLNFCTPRYVITREFGRDKLRVGWRIRAKRFEKRIRNSEDRLIKLC